MAAMYSAISAKIIPCPPDFVRGWDSYTWDWPDRVSINGKVTGIFADYHYIGTGDIGGSPTKKVLRWKRSKLTVRYNKIPSYYRRRSRDGGHGAVQPVAGPPVRSWRRPAKCYLRRPPIKCFATSQGLDLSKMPRYKGDLEFINHSAGSITARHITSAGIAKMNCSPPPPKNLASAPRGSAAAHIRKSA